MNILNKKIIFIILAISVLSIFCLSKKFVVAQMTPHSSGWLDSVKSSSKIENFSSVKTTNPGLEATEDQGWLQQRFDELKAINWEKMVEALKTKGSLAFYTALKSALQTMAYDTATWIGSGGKGQSALFIKEDWGTYLMNVGDNAVGNMMEEFGKKNGIAKFNLCQMDASVKLKISMGMMQYSRPSASSCTFTKMKQNWEGALKSKTFLRDFSNMFQMGQNEVGAALIVMGEGFKTQEFDLNKATLDLKANKGWLNVRKLNKDLLGTPEQAANRQKNVESMLLDNLSEYTGDAFIDAANIFLNQLAITLFQNLMSNLGDDVDYYSEAYSGTYGLTNYEEDASGGSISNTKAYLSKINEPMFNVRGDYDILAQLSMCPDPNKAGPTDCVISEKFKQAIMDKITVGEALTKGYLNKTGKFGFISKDKEPRIIDEDYPYRSMIILRKFRILPIGWEVAAQKINNDGVPVVYNLEQMVACFDPEDNYTGFNDNGSQSWCAGLVDPNWVLKAPKNYCKREGYGTEIQSEQITGTGEDSKTTISRSDDYCADEQSCIQENDDGSCNTYGYCTEDRRKWNFNSKSCQPIYNTCQTFKSSNGKSVSYLQNTLNYDNCSIDNAGCRAYATSSTAYASSTDKISWNSSDPIYLDRDAKGCESSSEGCHAFIRTKAGIGANLLANSSFEDGDTGWQLDNGAIIDDSEKQEGAYSLRITGNSSADVKARKKIADILPNEKLSIYFYVKTDLNIGSATGTWMAVYAYDGNNEIIPDPQTNTDWLFGSAIENSVSGNEEWKRIEFNINAPANIDHLVIEPRIQAGAVGYANFDVIKVEYGQDATTYSDYGENGLIYEKLLPAYLYQSCYIDPANGNYSLRSDAPGVCGNFARLCNEDEANCELYTARKNSDIKIPARVTADDYCPSECVGYNTYIQGETVFDSLRTANLIPNTSAKCSAEAAGCDEFTNLDELDKEAEEKQYYSRLRQCVKENDSACREFYTWEGTEDTGFQLRLFKLKSATTADNKIEPATTEDTGSECNADIYKKEAGDPGYNADCRQFYNTQGDLFYKLYTRTITCDDDCHPFRRTEKNIDYTITAAANCTGEDKHWSNDVCFYCKNGGVWNNEHGACIYMAKPGEGKKCSAAQAGCRQYIGNSGNNLKNIFNHDFESGTNSGWTSGEISSESLVAGEHSLKVDSSATSFNVDGLLTEGKPYVLSFMIRSESASTINDIYFANAYGKKLSFSPASVSVGSDWSLMEFNLPNFGQDASSTDALYIETAGSGYYIDNIKLVQISDTYYLIKNSWTTPDSCDMDHDGNVSPGYMLGCESYTDRDKMNHNLHNFTQLCQDSAIGCELMIDTQNSTDYKAATGTYPVIPEDKIVYAVYNKNMLCDSDNKGCQRLGQISNYGEKILYKDVYLKNNPDKYATILCEKENVGCDEFSANDGLSYFIDPGDQTCEWRQGTALATSSWGWFKKKVNKCDASGNGVIENTEKNICTQATDCAATTTISDCSSDADCGGSGVCKNKKCYQACLLDNNDYPCRVSGRKTFGYGGMGKTVYQPTAETINDVDYYWAGLCPASESSCTEYIDPISFYSVNMIRNANFATNLDNDGIADSWRNTSQNNGMQWVSLKPNTMYALSSEGDQQITVQCQESLLAELTDDNTLASQSSAIIVNSISGERNSKRFYVGNVNSLAPSDCSVSVSDCRQKSNNNSKVELKKAIIDYQLSSGVDKKSCNGLVDLETGCVLFNERTAGKTYATTVFDADLTKYDGVGLSPRSNSDQDKNDSHVIIKVDPDRVCDKWLACKSYVKDETNKTNQCFEIGLCDGINETGDCNSFVYKAKENETYGDNNLSYSEIGNYVGYSKVGYGSGVNSFTEPNNYYPFSTMQQKGEVGYLSNGGFEYYNSDGYTMGWILDGEAWSSKAMTVISSPYIAQTEGIGKAPVGASFLKIGSTYKTYSEYVDVLDDVWYVVSAYVNTINLTKGNAEIKIEEYGDSGERLSPINSANNSIIVNSGNTWKYVMGKFKTTSNTSRIRIWLESSDDSPIGNYYFDDIQIRPTLESKCISGEGNECQRIDENYSAWYTPQSCRLYPESDSMSCDYYDDSGIRNKGWWGYCLEYDRYPGSSDTCLLWWPIDKVKGDGIEEGAGYKGRGPLYYCTDMAFKNVSVSVPKHVCYNEGYNYYTVAGSEFASAVSPSWYSQFLTKKLIDSVTINRASAVYSESDIWTGSGADNDWAETITVSFNLDGSINEVVGGFATGHENHTCADGDYADFNFTVNYKVPYCTKVSQVVTSTGQNKYWSGRVYEGSSFQLPCTASLCLTNPYSYSTDYYPFGSVYSPTPSYNPVLWDGNYTPLYFTSANQPRAGQLHTDAGVRRLFAQSYGTWTWSGDSDNGVYNQIYGQDWSPPNNACNGTGLSPRPATAPADFCGIKPKVTNIKVDDKASEDINITKNKFINLKFNTDVDENQMPLVMYAIDWGDGEKTLVSGVEMRARPDPNNPHSLYHMYDYGDLKAKDANNIGEISCGVVNDVGYCSIKPKVRVKDNWGWCSDGSDGTPCPSITNAAYTSYGKEIIVRER